MANGTKKDFFISYNKADRSWAEWIAWNLDEAGYTTVLQAWDFFPGSNFAVEMQRATSDAQRTIAVLSPDYLTSSFTQPEWAAAFARDPTGEKALLLPVRVRDCDLKGLLPQVIYLDILGLEETAARNRLLKGVSKGRGKLPNKPRFPGDASRLNAEKPRFPRIWNVPNRNRNFTGRDQLLRDLQKKLTLRPAALTQTQAMTGLGGVGKTQIAIEYAYLSRAEYEIVWWIRAEEPATLAADFAALAIALDLPAKDASEQTAIVKAVRQWLSQTTRPWLLILDNAQGVKDVDEYLPQSVSGHILITSRNQSWRRVAGVLSVELMDRDEAVEFLLKRTKKSDRKAARELAKLLGDLPLALEQVGAYIEESDISIARYLELFRTQRELLEDEPEIEEPTVTTIWEISFKRVEKESPAAQDLLSLCAFLAPDEIPLEMITRKEKQKQQNQHLTESLAKAIKNPTALLKVISALRRYSLVKVTTESFLLSVHRLVQRVSRNRLSPQSRKDWARTAVVLLNEAFQFDSDEEAWPACSTLLPHALAATEYATELQVAYKETDQLLSTLGKYFVARSEFVAVKAAFEQALSIHEKVLGRDHYMVAEDATRLGFLLKNHGDLLGAKRYFEKAQKIHSKGRGPSRSQLAVSLNNLGILLRDLGDLDGAQKAFERALKINQDDHGEDSREVAVNLNNLGYLLKDRKDLDAAQSHFERALEINKKSSANDLSIATNLNNLGIIAKDKGDLADARKYFENALDITEKACGPNNPEIVTSLSNLGFLMKDQSEAEAAREYFERGLEITEKAYGLNHPQVATSLNNLGYLLRDKDVAAAQPYFERALIINELAHGPDHPIVASTLKNLSELRTATGDLADARTQLERALAIDQAAYGSNHVVVAADLSQLGGILQRQGEIENARSRYEEAVKIFEKLLDHSDPRTAEARNKLASLDKERAVGR
jgi:tetratricopeptide (TPR) repeat protein